MDGPLASRLCGTVFRGLGWGIAIGRNQPKKLMSLFQIWVRKQKNELKGL